MTSFTRRGTILHMASPYAWRSWACSAALALAADLARADALRFEGDLPDSPHVLIDLTAAQLRAIPRAVDRRHPFPEIPLTRAQRDRLREETGADVRWLFAARKEWLAGDCTCGTYNLGEVVGRRLAVLKMDLGDHLGSAEFAALWRDLVDPALRAAEPEQSAVVHRHDFREDPVELRALASRFPGASFERRIPLRSGWRPQRFRVAVLPRASEVPADIAPSLHTLSAVVGRASPGSSAEWPRVGARLDTEGRVYLLLPGLVEGEIGPRGRAWFLLEYQEGRLVAAFAQSAEYRTGATYEWRDAER